MVSRDQSHPIHYWPITDRVPVTARVVGDAQSASIAWKPDEIIYCIMRLGEPPALLRASGSSASGHRPAGRSVLGANARGRNQCKENVRG